MLRIAIDGPGGAGKSSVAKAVAARLGILYTDTGALYRTIGLYMLRANIDTKDAAAVSAALPRFTVELKYQDGRQVIFLDGEDVGDTIRTPAVSMAASDVSAIGAVREHLLKIQQDIANTNDVVMDGRDIGTRIIPDAEVKIFLTAKEEVRAQRRYLELQEKGVSVTYEQVLTEMRQRDLNDSTREIAPCQKASDAVLLDNSDLSAEQTVERVVQIAEAYRARLRAEARQQKRYMRFRAFLNPFFRFFFRVHIRGAENIPKDGPLIVCANHIAVRDIFVLGATLPRPIRFLAKKELFRIPVIGPLMKVFGAVSLDREGADVGAIRTAITLARDGNAVAIFPQGHRNPGVNPAETRIHNGAALITYRAGADVLPICIHVKNYKYGFLRPIEVLCGEPIPYDALGFKDGGSQEYTAATTLIFNRILALGGYGTLPAPDADEGEHR